MGRGGRSRSRSRSPRSRSRSPSRSRYRSKDRYHRRGRSPERSPSRERRRCRRSRSYSRSSSRSPSRGRRARRSRSRSRREDYSHRRSGSRSSRHHRRRSRSRSFEREDCRSRSPSPKRAQDASSSQHRSPSAQEDRNDVRAEPRRQDTVTHNFATRADHKQPMNSDPVAVASHERERQGQHMSKVEPTRVTPPRPPLAPTAPSPRMMQPQSKSTARDIDHVTSTTISDSHGHSSNLQVHTAPAVAPTQSLAPSPPLSTTSSMSTTRSRAAPLDPGVVKRREERLEARRAYLKCVAESNRAETRLFALQADLDVAEFWLNIAAKNLEDVGRRTELQDWRFKKLEEGADIEELFSTPRLGLH